MNYPLTNIPERTEKPRVRGITMVIDKGLSISDVENLLGVAGPYIDLVKLGWGTSFVTPNLEQKLTVYKNGGVPVYFGGTLFESFVIRRKFDSYCQILANFGIQYAEVSDGSIDLSHQEKCSYINQLSSYVTVISEVGSKDAQKVFTASQWTQLMQDELASGSWKVIAEARESGNVGIYQDSGNVRTDIVSEIINKIPQENIIWETPRKEQQVWFIKLLGANVNLGNIAPSEVISVETLRLGLRSDTFHHFLDQTCCLSSNT